MNLELEGSADAWKLTARQSDAAGVESLRTCNLTERKKTERYGTRKGFPDMAELRVPEEVVSALGEDPEREALEALLLHLIRKDKVSVTWAGTKLGLGRQEAIRWYTSHGYPFPDITPEEFDEEVRQAEQL